MSDPLSLLIRASLAFSGGAVLAMALRLPLRRFAGAQAGYSLWLLPPLAAFATLLPAPAPLALLPAPVAPIAMVTQSFAGGPISAQAMASSVPAGPWLEQLALTVWLVGAVCVLLALIARQALYARREAGPAVVGGFAPRIVLPADFERRYTPAEQALVLAHERVHLAARHPQTNLFACLLLCLQWFNPLAHLALRLMRIDQELACDADVMRRHPGSWRTYGEAMLKADGQLSGAPIVCAWPTRSPTLIKERFSMLTFKSNRRRATLAASGLSLLFVGAAAAAYSAQPALSSAPSPKPGFAAVAAALSAPRSAPDSVTELAAAQTPPRPIVKANSAAGTPPKPKVVALTAATSAPDVPAVYTKADWATAPTSAQIAAVYPTRDQDAGIGGSARLHCFVSSQGAVHDCALIEESPRGEGFGAAAVSLAPFFAMKPKQQEGVPLAGETTIPVTFTPTSAVATPAAVTVNSASRSSTTDIQLGQPDNAGRYSLTISSGDGAPAVLRLAKGESADIGSGDQSAKITLSDATTGGADAVKVAVSRPSGALTMILRPGARGAISSSSSASSSTSATPGP